jgi:phospholipid/cholesterol/gamma-HCH transport system substrate-binding protein
MTQIKVGVFLALGIITFLISVFILGSNKSLFQEVIEVHSYFDSTQGLIKGAVVSLSGVKVGNIDRVEFDETKNLVRITSSIQEDYKNKIKKDSRIEMRTNGALGDKYLYITPGTINSESIVNGDELKADYGNDLISVFSKRGNESEKIFDILNNLNAITQSLAQQNKLPQIADNLNKTTQNLAQITESLNKTVQNGAIDRSTQKFERILDKIDRGDGTLGALINDKSIHESIKNLLGSGQKNQQVKSILKSSVEE